MRAARAFGGIVLIVCMALPFAPLAIWSFARGWRYPDLAPERWSLDAWTYALSDLSGVLEGLALSAVVAAGATFASLAIGVPAGRALALRRFRGRALVTLLILAPAVAPLIAAVFGLHAIFIGLGLNNSVAGVALAHLIPTLPYVVFVSAGVFATFDTDFEAQARSLGAPPLAVLRHVTLPAVFPGIMVGALFAFLVSWSQYLLTFVIGGGRVATLPLLLFNFASAGRNDIAGAIALIYAAPGALILLFVARRLTGRGAALAGRP